MIFKRVNYIGPQSSPLLFCSLPISPFECVVKFDSSQNSGKRMREAHGLGNWIFLWGVPQKFNPAHSHSHTQATLSLGVTLSSLKHALDVCVCAWVYGKVISIKILTQYWDNREWMRGRERLMLPSCVCSWPCVFVCNWTPHHHRHHHHHHQKAPGP